MERDSEIVKDAVLIFLSYINVLSIFQGIFSGCLNRSLVRKVSSMPMVQKEGREDS